MPGKGHARSSPLNRGDASRHPHFDAADVPEDTVAKAAVAPASTGRLGAQSGWRCAAQLARRSNAIGMLKETPAWSLLDQQIAPLQASRPSIVMTTRSPGRRKFASILAPPWDMSMILTLFETPPRRRRAGVGMFRRGILLACSPSCSSDERRTSMTSIRLIELNADQKIFCPDDLAVYQAPAPDLHRNRRAYRQYPVHLAHEPAGRDVTD